MIIFHCIDAWVLGLFTKFAHQFQLLTGKTNFFLAKCGIAMALLSATLHIINFFHQILPLVETGGTFLINVLILWNMFGGMVDVEKADESNQDPTVKVAVEGITLGINKFFRLLFLHIAILVTIGSISGSSRYAYWIYIVDDLSFVYGSLIYYYFIAVEPLRPGKSRIRQWVEKMFVSKEPVPIPSRG